MIPKFTPSNDIVKDIFAFAHRIELSEGYLDDCRRYIKLYNQKNRRNGRAMSTWPNVFLKLMRAMMTEYPELDLATLTMDEVVTKKLPCRSIAEAVQAGYLEKVPGYEFLDKAM